MTTCAVCNLDFPTRKELFTHKRVDHHGKTPCPKCGLWVKSVRYHLNDVHDYPAGSTTCTTCGSRFQRRSALRLHMRKQHERPKSILCSSCPATFTYPHDLHNHIKDRHLARHECVQCEKTFGDRSGLRSHVQVVHCGLRVQCPICERKFSSKYAVRGHIESIHEAKQWPCPGGCTSSFRQRSSSIQHYRSVHQGAKYKCTVCAKSYTRPDSLSSHRRRIHLQLERGQCGHCEKTLASRSSMLKHLSTVHKLGL